MRFERELATSAAVLEAMEHATSRGAIVISALDVDGVSFLPGSLPAVIGVRLDWDVPRNAVLVDDRDRAVVRRASGYPRPIPGIVPTRNLSGISFAVANVSSFIARSA